MIEIILSSWYIHLMTTLKIANDYCYLDTEDEALKTRLWKAFRVRGKNYWHSAAYKRKIWDGYIDFFKLNTGRFLTGLLPEIKVHLIEQKIPVKIQDMRVPPIWAQTTIDKNFLKPFNKKKKVELYDYQVDSVNQALKYGRGLIQFPTAAGKTYILISVLKCLPPKTPVLFMTKNKGLVNQNYKEMIEWGIPNVGRWYDKYHEPNYIMCVTAHQKTFESLHKLLPNFKVLIVDEVHECMSDLCVKLFPRLTAATVRLGISATPFKFGGKDIEQKLLTKGHFGSVFKTSTTESGLITTNDLQERKILSESNCTFYYIDEPKTIKHEPYGDAVTLGIASNFYFLDIVKRIALKQTGRTLILVERREQGEFLKQLIPGSIWIHGKDKLDVREDVYEDLRTEDNFIAIATRHIITAGINVFLHNLINASGGKADHSIIQQMGRGLRNADDKDILNYIDFIFRTNDYLEDHSKLRLKVLVDEKHTTVIKEDMDF